MSEAASPNAFFLDQTAVGTPQRRVSSSDESHAHIRGSGLLLAGRLIACVLNFAVQVLIVRYLSKTDFGAFAYALAVASMASSGILLGLGKALPRLVPIYFEKHDLARTFGSIVLAIGAVAGLGVSLVLLLHGFAGTASNLVGNAESLALLMIVIALAPIDALDHLLQQVAAVFVGAKAIFFRRQILGPGLKLAAIAAVIAIAGDARMLAYGYVAGGFIGVCLYVAVLVKEWRARGLLEHLMPRRLVFPGRELFGFSLPLMSAELGVLWRGAIAVLILEYFRPTSAVADYRAVLPVAGMNMIVCEAFAFLYVPNASKLFARENFDSINSLYWHTSIWVAVLTFPIFAATCVLSGPLTVLLFGEAYAEAGVLLALLAIGFYVNAVIGFNAATLRVYGHVKLLLAGDLLAAAIAVLGSCVLVQFYGALGAAIATTTALILHNLFSHIGLRIAGTGIRLIDSAFVRVQGIIGLLLVSLALVQWLLAPSMAVSLAMVAAMSVMLIRATRREVKAASTFPELLRIPVLRWLLA